MLKDRHKYSLCGIVHNEEKRNARNVCPLENNDFNECIQNTFDKIQMCLTIPNFKKNTHWNKPGIETSLINWRVTSQNYSKHHPQQNQGISGINIRKKEYKLFLFKDYVIFYLENPRETIERGWE